MQYTSHTDQDKLEMLQTIGVADLEDLLKDIPSELRLKNLELPSGMPEMDLVRFLGKKGQKNVHLDRSISFLGGGNYDHYIPPVVDQLAMRSEFLTAYTPYQGEASQGTLQSIYEFQSLICLLTRMDVANASMYDGASAAAEAALMVLRGTERKRILVSEAIHPETIETIRTYLCNIDVDVVTVGQKEGLTDLESLKKNLSEGTAAVLFQHPNFFGYLEDAPEIGRLAKNCGASVITIVNPVSLSVLEPPGNYGADVAVGEGQPLGNPVSYGGPHFGFFASRGEFMRKLPGRVCGLARDREGKRAFVLTLQAREQHIRREKATSNICTNHALCALRATIFLSLLGEQGFRKMGELNVERSHEACRTLSKLKGVKLFSREPFFNEFTIWIDKDPRRLRRSFSEEGIIGPLPLVRLGDQWRGAYLVAVTDQRTPEDIECLARAIRNTR